MNVVASNSFFNKKREIYKKSKFYLTKSIAQKDAVGVHSSVNRINELLKTFDGWGKEEIRERQAMLLNLARGIWRTQLIP
jgi:hypothetical protein